jgi:hypothetical protein
MLNCVEKILWKINIIITQQRKLLNNSRYYLLLKKHVEGGEII